MTCRIVCLSCRIPRTWGFFFKVIVSFLFSVMEEARRTAMTSARVDGVWSGTTGVGAGSWKNGILLKLSKHLQKWNERW